MTPWEIKAREFVNCNCDWGCPCQFNAMPTHGQCEATGAIAIDEGHYGDVSLDNTKIAFVFWWPGAVHEGNGKCVPIVDESATEEQRNALLTIMSGQDSDPFATMFNVYASTMEEVFEPVFTRIDFDVDIEGRTGRIRVDGYIDASGEPIRNPVTGEEQRARIDLLNGFEYSLAEMGNASSKTSGPIELRMENTYAQFAHLHLNNHGPIHA